MSIKEKVNSIIKEVKPLMNLERSDDLIEGGYFDSLELMVLISMLNESFNIEIPIEEISPENFNSIDSIAKMTERLLM